MNCQNSNHYNIYTDSKKAIVNSIEYPYKRGMTGKNSTIINGKIYIDGHELKDGKWRRTIRALWHMLF